MRKQNNTRGRYLHKTTRPRAKQMIACCALTATLFCGSLAAQTPQRDTVRTLDEVIIRDARVSNKAPLTTSTIGRDELDDARGSVSLPYMLEAQPSVVASGEKLKPSRG